MARSIPHSAFRIPHPCDKFHKPPTRIPMATDSILRPGELKDILLKEIQAADLAEIDVRGVGTGLEVKEGIARIYGLTSRLAGGMVEFSTSETGGEGIGQGLKPGEGNNGGLIVGGHTCLRREYAV